MRKEKDVILISVPLTNPPPSPQSVSVCVRAGVCVCD